MAYDVQIAIDSSDPHELAAWYADALGWQVEPQDEDFIRRMIAEGHATEADTTTHRGKLVWATGAAINSPDSGRPRIYFQKVPEPKTGKNRLHLDVRTDDKEAVLERLVARGAKELWRANEGPHWWITIADPEGNELCLN
jgi:hypothetical protein